MADIEKLPVIYRTANALIAYFLYLAKTLYPLDLAAFYPLYRSASEWRWTLIWALPALLLLLSISGWCIRSRDKRPYLGVGWFWYVGTLLPVIGLVQVGRQSMADRYTYIPLIGIFVMLTWGAAALLKTRHQRPLAPALLSGFCLLMLSFLSVRQVATWKNTLTVFSHADAITGNNYLAKSKVAREHFEAGNYQKALELLKKAIEINPSSAEAYSRAGKVYDALGQPEQAIAYFTKALELNPRSPETHTNLGIVLARRANLKAERHLRDALELDPEYAMGHLNMGVFLSQTGRVEPAVSHLLQAIRLKNDFADAHFNLGVLYEMQNKPEDAVRHYTLALKFKPSYAGEPYRLRDYIRAMHETAHPNAGGQ
jgi:tetratricopeptide (TPR) repeat protein